MQFVNPDVKMDNNSWISSTSFTCNSYSTPTSASFCSIHVLRTLLLTFHNILLKKLFFHFANGMYFWSVLEWLDGVLPQASLAAIYALALITLCSLIREWFHSRKTSSNVRTPKSDRKLDPLENLRYKGYLGSGCTQSIVLCIKSKVPINIKRVREAFTLLMERHPLLAVRVDTREEADGIRTRNRVRYFREMKEETILDFSLKRTSADQWKEKFQRELNKSFSSNQVAPGSLWRVAVLKENFLLEEEAYENAIIITAHPVICDAISLVKLCDQFLQILNSHSELQLDKGTIRLPIRPGISSLLRHIIAVSTFGKFYLACNVILEGLIKKMKGGAKNQFTTVFPPPRLTESSIMKRTGVILLTLSKELMQKLLIVCKQKECSMHSVMSAVSAVAMATVLQNGKLVVPMKIPFVFEWSIRKNCRPQIEDNEFGCFILDCRKEVSVPAIDIGSSDFWDFAVTCMKKLQSAISKGEHFQELKILSELNLRSKTNMQRGDMLFRLSNISQHEITEDSSTVYKFNGMQFASEIDDNGPVFGNNVVSLNGELFWSIAYSTRTVTDNLANAFAKNILSILLKIICS